MPTFPSLNESILKQNIDAVYLQRGKSYQQYGNVKQLIIRNEGKKMTASVAGTHWQPYQVSIQIQIDENQKKIRIYGDCSCPIGFNCKHVAAVLYQALAEKNNFSSRHNHELQSWLKHLDTALQAPQSSEEKQSDAQHLLYVLSLKTELNASVLYVSLMLSRRLKNGAFGKANSYRYDPTYTNKALTKGDHKLCHMLQLYRKQHFITEFGNSYKLQGETGVEILLELLKTERCFWGSNEGKPLTLGETLEANFSWQLMDDGSQRLQVRVSGANVVILPLIPLWYIDLSARTCGSLTTDLEPHLALALLNAPTLHPEHIKQFYTELRKRELADKTPLPIEFKNIREHVIEPKPTLRLVGETIAVKGYSYHANENLVHDIPCAELIFYYDKKPVYPRETQTEIFLFEKNNSLRIPRDFTYETAAIKKLHELGLVELSHNRHGLITLEPHQNDYLLIGDPHDHRFHLHFVVETIPQLQSLGWQVTIDENFPIKLVYDADDWYSEISEPTDHDWFDLELGIVIDGERINILPLLLNFLTQHIPTQGIHAIKQLEHEEYLFIPMPNKKFLRLPTVRVKGILQTITELYDSRSFYGNEKLRLSRLRIAQLLELEKAMGVTSLRWLGGKKLLSLGKRLRDFSGIKNVDIPNNFHAQLRHYQHDGVNWLQFLREYDLAGILADDMGLGKTVQTLAHILIEKSSGRMKKPCLVVAPTSLMTNWHIEAHHFTPDLKVLILHGANRKKHFTTLTDHDVILTTYPLLARDREILLDQEYHLLILDEAQIIKNAKAKSTQIVQQLKANHRVCLTGTPMENHLGELWSLFNFLMPGLLGNPTQFKRLFADPIEKHQDANRRRSLATRVAPFMLRRTKQQVIKELPPKTEIISNVEISGAQLDLYESVRIALHKNISEAIRNKGLARSHIVVLDALLKLRQICCHPRLLKLDTAKHVHHSAKLDLLFEMLPSLIEEGRRILLFSSFTSMLKIIEEELVKRQISYETLTGKTLDRATPITRFQQGEVPLFLISLKAGGLGLNLTAADTVIHYDPWWNPAAEKQATDRAYRIGQNKAVFVYKLITMGTVEEKILTMQTKKQQLLDSLFSEKAHSQLQLSTNDLEYLFQPLESG